MYPEPAPMVCSIEDSLSYVKPELGAPVRYRLSRMKAPAHEETALDLTAAAPVKRARKS